MDTETEAYPEIRVNTEWVCGYYYIREVGPNDYTLGIDDQEIQITHGQLKTLLILTAHVIRQKEPDHATD